jgi:hypothetical protein
MKLALSLFVSTAIVKAVPMSRQDYNEYKGLEYEEGYGPVNKDGYLVELQVGDEKPNHPDHAGAIMFYDKESFDRHFYRSGNMPFGVAVELLKKGYRVARAGWDGKGMFLQYVDPYAPCPDQLENPEVRLSGTMNTIFKPIENKYTPGTLLPWIGMKTADNKFVPWLASQTDILATDWMIAQ